MYIAKYYSHIKDCVVGMDLHENLVFLSLDPEYAIQVWQLYEVC